MITFDIGDDSHFSKLYENKNNFVCYTGIYTRERMHNYKSLEAYKYFESGWVQTIKYHCPRVGMHVVYAKVLRSQATTEEPVQAWLALSTSSGVTEVSCAHCTCMAGLVFDFNKILLFLCFYMFISWKWGIRIFFTELKNLPFRKFVKKQKSFF